MSRRFEPFIHVDRTGFDTCAVCNADVKVNADIVAPNAKLARRIVWSPHLDSLEGADLLSALLEFLINRTFNLAIARAGAGQRNCSWSGSSCRRCSGSSHLRSSCLLWRSRCRCRWQGGCAAHLWVLCKWRQLLQLFEGHFHRQLFSLLPVGEQLVAYLCISDNSVNDHLGVLVCLLAVVLYPVGVAEVFELPYLVNEVHNLACHDFNCDVQVYRELSAC